MTPRNAALSGTLLVLGLRMAGLLNSAPARLLVHGAVLVLLALAAVQAFLAVRAGLPLRPLKPRQEVIPPVVVSAPPASHLLDPVSGAAVLSPAYVAWGRALHVKRLAHQDAVTSAAAQQAAAAQRHESELAAWERWRASADGQARLQLREAALRTMTVAGLCALVVGLWATPAPRSLSNPVALTSATATPSAPSSPHPVASGSAPVRTPTPTPGPTAPPATGAAAEPQPLPPTATPRTPTATSRTPTATSARTVTATPSPSLTRPATLPDADVVRAVPDCVGGVCRLLARTDVLQQDRSGAPTRVIVAVLRKPDDSLLGPSLAFVAVDAASRALMGSTHASGVRLSGELRQDGDGRVWALVESPADSYRSGPELRLLSLSYGWLRDDAVGLSNYQDTDVEYVGLDTTGHFRWRASHPLDGSVVTTTYGWGGSSYQAVACSRSRNGDTVTYDAKAYGSC